MKNVFLTLFTAILFVMYMPNRVFSVNNNQLITELTVFDNDSTFRYIYLYDNLGKKVLETKYYEQDNTWLRKSQIEWLYQGNRCITQYERIWNNNAWLISYTIDYKYENDRLKTEIDNSYSNGIATPIRLISYQYNVSLLSSKSDFYWHNGAWELSQTDGFTYFANGKTETDTTCVYQTGGILKQQNLSTFSYGLDGTLSSQLIQEKETNTDWINTEFVNWYYTPVSKLIQSQRKKKWITETSKWENSQKIEYIYNANDKLVNETDYYWEAMYWGNVAKYDCIYNGNGLLEKKVFSLPIYGHWQNISTINYSDFNGNNANLMESQYEFWGGNTGELTNSYIPYLFNNDMTVQKGKRLQIVYNEVDVDGISTIKNYDTVKQVPVYPNPSVGMFYIQTEKYPIQSWTVSDLNGRLIKTQLQSFNSGVIDITDMPNGVYILRVTTNNSQLTQKLIKK